MRRSALLVLLLAAAACGKGRKTAAPTEPPAVPAARDRLPGTFGLAEAIRSDLRREKTRAVERNREFEETSEDR